MPLRLLGLLLGLAALAEAGVTTKDGRNCTNGVCNHQASVPGSSAERPIDLRPWAAAAAGLLLGAYCVYGRSLKQLKGWLVLALLKCVFPVGRPSRRFAEGYRSPDPPDYGQPSWWAAYPGRPSPAEATPAGQPPVPIADRPAACFFVHPTGYFEGEFWNEPRPSPASDRLTDGFMHTDGSAFNQGCRVYAPHYRQAIVAAQLFDRQSGIKAMELAYSDVKQAFIWFLQQEPTAPLVLASHSQGGQHLVRLLAELIEPDLLLQRRLVAVYAIGTNVLPRDMFDRSFPSLHPSNGPTDTPCAVIAWDTKAEPEARKRFDPDLLAEFPGFWYRDSGWQRPPADTAMLNTNPLSWKSAVGVRVSDGWLGGACLRLPDGTRPYSTKEFFRGRLSPAQCQPPLDSRGHIPAGQRFYAESLPHCLLVPHLDKSDRGVFGDFTQSGDYHVLDYPLFYYNIRQNVRDRISAFLAKQNVPGSELQQSENTAGLERCEGGSGSQGLDQQVFEILSSSQSDRRLIQLQGPHLDRLLGSLSPDAASRIKALLMNVDTSKSGFISLEQWRQFWSDSAPLQAERQLKVLKQHLSRVARNEP